MSQTSLNVPILQHVFHPSDFSPASEAAFAHATEADLIVMATEGRNGFLDALRGSHSEQVLRQCACPLLAIPAGGWVSSVL